MHDLATAQCVSFHTGQSHTGASSEQKVTYTPLPTVPTRISGSRTALPSCVCSCTDAPPSPRTQYPHCRSTPHGFQTMSHTLHRPVQILNRGGSVTAWGRAPTGPTSLAMQRTCGGAWSRKLSDVHPSDWLRCRWCPRGNTDLGARDRTQTA